MRRAGLQADIREHAHLAYLASRAKRAPTVGASTPAQSALGMTVRVRCHSEPVQYNYRVNHQNDEGG